MRLERRRELHIGETANNGDTVIYGVDNLARGIAYSRDVARMWASSPDLVMALQTIADIAEGRMPGRGMKSIAKLARAAERSAQEEGGAEDSYEPQKPIRPEDLFAAVRLGVEGTDADRVMYLRVIAARYPQIEGLKELAAKYHNPFGILRTGAETDSRGVTAARFAERFVEAQKERDD